jgi:hypothetical protein
MNKQVIDIWNDIRSQFQGKTLDRGTCAALARSILNNCFAEHRNGLLMYWFVRTLVKVNNGLRNYTTNLGEMAKSASFAALKDMFGTSPSKEEKHRFAMHKLQTEMTNNEEDAAEALAALQQLQPEEIESIGWPNIHHESLLQASLAVLLYVYNSDAVRDTQYKSMEDFVQRYKDVSIDRGNMLQMANVSERVLLYHNANFLRIALKFMRAQRGKKKLMDVASRATEGKIYITGSGHSPSTQMRERIYETETGGFDSRQYSSNFRSRYEHETLCVQVSLQRR